MFVGRAVHRNRYDEDGPGGRIGFKIRMDKGIHFGLSGIRSFESQEQLVWEGGEAGRT